VNPSIEKLVSLRRPFGQVRRAGARDTVDDGAVARDGRIIGTYLHGLFDADDFRHAFLRASRAVCGLAPPTQVAYVAAERDARINRLAMQVAGSLDVDALLEWIGLRAPCQVTAETRV
jgi:adenosylcobyric acid synthase